MTLSANQAAKEAGVAKKTLLEAIKTGRMSASKNDKGHWQIDPAELFRVFPKTGIEPVTETDTHPPQKTIGNSALEVEVKMLREQLEFKDEILAEIRQERDDWKGQAKTLLIANQNHTEGQGGKRGFFRLFRSQ
ncbi:hypothetical protein [uncultured Roseobacter sp.]|uniref:hypothetical protein n=1 Tax=uncultured Roseobacter sp. TaxID=114847 RepID=UPI00262F6BBC|nr:hypothetical protein [uncultured Roseobacter sp.]